MYLLLCSLCFEAKGQTFILVLLDNRGT